MKSAHFPNLDLNLLRVFQALLEERSATRAGDRLGLTQSAVSHALNRLRIALDDELFIRTAEGMRPTPWAAEAGPRVADILDQLQRALAPTYFDPKESDRKFALGMSTYLSTVLAPALVGTFRAKAPMAELVLRHAERSLSEALDFGRVDVALGVFGQAPERFERCKLFEERLVWVMRRGHPMARSPLTLETLLEVPHAFVSVADSPADMEVTFNDHGIERRLIFDDGGAYAAALATAPNVRPKGMTAPDSHTVLAIAAQTDMAALAPLRLAERYRDALNLRLFDPPYPSRPMMVEALWRRDYGAHPALRWLLQILREEAGRI